MCGQIVHDLHDVGSESMTSERSSTRTQDKAAVFAPQATYCHQPDTFRLRYSRRGLLVPIILRDVYFVGVTSSRTTTFLERNNPGGVVVVDLLDHKAIRRRWVIKQNIEKSNRCTYLQKDRNSNGLSFL